VCVRRYQPRVFAVALAVLGDPGLAEDVSQQTFERAWRRASSFDAARGSLRAWLTTIAHNLAVDAVRARKPTATDPDDLTACSDPTPTIPNSRRSEPMPVRSCGAPSACFRPHRPGR
jgi:RNA polymerase sigma factor (sigma-70 family)